MSKQPTPYQIKSQLAYTSTTPAFLQRMKNQMAGRSGDDDGDNEDYDNWEPGVGSSSGRRSGRATPPRRPDDDPGSADEDDDFDDERPQVVVLKEGKHLTALEAENERRKQKGLPPLADPGASSKKKDEPANENESKAKSESESKKAGSQSQKHSLSFSSTAANVKSTKKRKLEEPGIKGGSGGGETKKPKKQKGKKEGKSLLSFGDGDLE